VRTAQQERSESFLNNRATPLILALAVFSTAVYGALAAAGDLRGSLPLYLICHAGLSLVMLAAWGVLARTGRGGAIVLGAALVFRLIAALGAPSLSDDVYRYVWDGRVQTHGVHPYGHPPNDPALSQFRDRDWESINHPELRTIYPPLAQGFFFILAAVGAGPVGFRLALGCVDFAVVLALVSLLRRLGLPRARVVLYAWNPLAVVEVAGSGHVEPLAVVFLLLAAGWIMDRRDGLSTLALAASLHAKLLPAILIPGFWRHYSPRARLLLPFAVAAGFLPLAIWGPAIGAGLFAYAERWEYNAFFYSGIQRGLEALDVGNLLTPWIEGAERRFGATAVPWEFLYSHIWPRDVARLIVAGVVAGWALVLAFKGRLELPREILLVTGCLLLFSPVVHPWYLLWVLPFAVAYLSWGWLVWGFTIPLAYLGAGSDVPWGIRCVEYLPPLVILFVCWRKARARERAGGDADRVC